MDSYDGIIPYLFAITFVIAIGIGLWQYRKVRKAQREHHRSASAVANHEAPVRAKTPAER